MIEHYPFTSEETEKGAKAVWDLQEEVISLPVFNNLKSKPLLAGFLSKYLSAAEMMFFTEEDARNQGKVGANLYYHNRNHAIYQTTYDAISLIQAATRNKGLSKHLSPESAIATVLGAAYHDTGYVYQPPYGEVNYAKRASGHVERSVDALSDKIDIIGFPSEIDTKKVKTLTRIGILNTTFPFTDEAKMAIKIMTDRLEPNLRKQAHVVRLAIQLADLGGQTARKDSFKTSIALKRELNGANPGVGDKVMGENDTEIILKRRYFIENIVKPEVGKSASAFFKSDQNPFALAWN